MNKTILTLSAAALALAGATNAYAQRDRGPDFDANGDGFVTLAEMQAHGAEMFGKMDVDGNGTIDEADRKARGAQMFAEADANGDDELTRAEMKAAHEARRTERREQRMAGREDRLAEHFDRMDADNSGGLSQAELDAMHEARGKRGGGEPDEVIEGRRHGGKHGMDGAKGPEGPHMLLRMADADGDRSVTRAEFDAALATHFAQIDADGDGLASAAEFKDAHEAMRAQRQERRNAKTGA